MAGEYLGASILALISLIFLTGGIRKNGFRALALYKQARILYLKWTGGRTEASEAEKRVISGQAWENWCESLKTAGATMVAPGCPQVSLYI